jgi:hypothetical protein
MDRKSVAVIERWVALRGRLMLGAGDCMECYGYNIELMLPLAIV